MVFGIGRINKFFTIMLTKCLLFPQFAPKDKPPNITFGGYFVLKTGGEGGMRTLDTFDSIPVFESATLRII
jgi:hypothetical protein